MNTIVIPTRRPLRVRLAAHLRVVYLRWLIRHAEADLRHHEQERDKAMSHWPEQIDLDRRHIDTLTRQLVRATHDL